MPTTYLLLRDNKQSGPHSLEALLLHNLTPHDLIWIEGQSAGWRYPSEINSLKPYLTIEVKAPVETMSRPTLKPFINKETDRKEHPHIYVSLPANRNVVVHKEESPSAVSLDEKADALYRRVQAFAEGRNTDEIDTRYARSLDAMKEEYGSWLVQQQKKKKQGTFKKKSLVAVLILAVATTSFAITKWIHKTPSLFDSPLANFTLSASTVAEKKQPTQAAYKTTTDTVTAVLNTALQQTPFQNLSQKTTSKAFIPARRKIQPPHANLLFKDSIMQAATTQPIPEQSIENKEVKRVIPLSQLVVVNGTLGENKKSNAATEVTLQNNSTETLKSVAVLITYFKKEDRALNKETIYFYNVQPGTAPALTASANRRATSAHFEIGTIVRADGSLYLIH